MAVDLVAAELDLAHEWNADRFSRSDLRARAGMIGLLPRLSDPLPRETPRTQGSGGWLTHRVWLVA
jgi:hypothetical protein